jgi:hypothetical protein
MFNALKDIAVTVIDGVSVATGINFGVPLVIGFTGSRTIIRVGSGIGGLIIQSINRHGAFFVEIAVTGASFVYEEPSADHYKITVPTGTRVRDLIADFAVNADADAVEMRTKFNILALTTGAGPVVAKASTEATSIEYQKLTDVNSLDYYYDSTDAEYKMVRTLLGSAPTPGTVYLLDSFGKSGSALETQIALYDTGDWFMGCTTEYTDEDTQITLAGYFSGVERMLLLVTDDVDRLLTVTGDNVAFVVHPYPGDHPEAAWMAKNLPSVPGVGWKWTPDLFGQKANDTALESDLQLIRDRKGNSYVRANGVSYMDGSKVMNIAKNLYIDQQISRKYIKNQIEVNLLTLFTSAAARGEKIPYTDGGIESITSTIGRQLTQAGRLGVIAPVETEIQAKNSGDGAFRFKVTSLTRTEIEGVAPADIANRILNGVKYSYVEAGAIEQVEITGVVLLSEG